VTFFGIEDLILLFEVSSLQNMRIMLLDRMVPVGDLPDFSDQIVNGVPGK
jgi:hypothetical protein